MKARILTAVPLAAAAGAAVLGLPSAWFGTLLLPMLWLAIYEWTRLSGTAARAAGIVPTLVAALGLAWLWLPAWDPSAALLLTSPGFVALIQLLVCVTGAFWLIFAAALVVTGGRPLSPGGTWRGAWLISAACIALIFLLHRTPATGPAMAFAVLVMIWASDIGAFFTGRRFGGPRLVPQISPGKTWSGLAGGLLAGLAAGGACVWLLPSLPAREMIHYAPAALLALIAGVAGDLAVSVLKRRAGVKDSGHLLPGHGGVLDRLDSSIAALPVFVLAAAFV